MITLLMSFLCPKWFLLACLWKQKEKPVLLIIPQWLLFNLAWGTRALLASHRCLEILMFLRVRDHFLNVLSQRTINMKSKQEGNGGKKGNKLGLGWWWLMVTQGWAGGNSSKRNTVVSFQIATFPSTYRYLSTCKSNF